jgi:glucose-1-phosphate cytidylyltransferase
MQTVILCGGRGMRLREYAEAIPKGLVEVGGWPILWHIMKSYAHYGFKDFTLTLGYLGERIKEYFLNYNAWPGLDLRVRLGSNDPPEPLRQAPEDWTITFADTGLDTNTGGRIKRIEPYVGEDVFFVTYGDGLSDIDLAALLAFHRSHGRIATVTVVKPRLTFGLLDIDTDQRVTRFTEKPVLSGWINGGFFVFNRRVFDYLEEDDVLELEPMAKLAADGELMAFRHEGFWACMDTYKDTVDLNAAWSAGEAPWWTWRDR